MSIPPPVTRLILFIEGGVEIYRHFGKKLPDLAKLASNLLHCNISLPSLFHFVFSFLPNSVANLDGTVAVFV